LKLLLPIGSQQTAAGRLGLGFQRLKPAGLPPNFLVYISLLFMILLLSHAIIGVDESVLIRILRLLPSQVTSQSAQHSQDYKRLTTASVIPGLGLKLSFGVFGRF